MKEKAKATKKRVFARLLAHELKNVAAGGDTGPTCVSTKAPPGGCPDVTNLEWDNDGPLEE